jgi:hypothetical protein
VKKKKAAVVASAAKDPLKAEDASSVNQENGTSLPDNDEQPKGT